MDRGAWRATVAKSWTQRGCHLPWLFPMGFIGKLKIRWKGVIPAPCSPSVPLCSEDSQPEIWLCSELGPGNILPATSPLGEATKDGDLGLRDALLRGQGCGRCRWALNPQGTSLGTDICCLPSQFPHKPDTDTVLTMGPALILSPHKDISSMTFLPTCCERTTKTTKTLMPLWHLMVWWWNTGDSYMLVMLTINHPLSPILSCHWYL